MAISSEYHRRQAATLMQLAQTTRDPDTAKALLRIAAEHIERADKGERLAADEMHLGLCRPLNRLIRDFVSARHRDSDYVAWLEGIGPMRRC